MTRPVDLPRIRRALAELDRIAAEHPEICQGVGQWDEKAVENIVMGTPAKERVRAMRERLAAKGIKRESFFLTPAARAALTELREQHPEQTRDRLLCDALISLLAAKGPTGQPEDDDAELVADAEAVLARIERGEEKVWTFEEWQRHCNALDS